MSSEVRCYHYSAEPAVKPAIQASLRQAARSLLLLSLLLLFNFFSAFPQFSLVFPVFSCFSYCSFVVCCCTSLGSPFGFPRLGIRSDGEVRNERRQRRVGSIGCGPRKTARRSCSVGGGRRRSIATSDCVRANHISGACDANKKERRPRRLVEK